MDDRQTEKLQTAILDAKKTLETLSNKIAALEQLASSQPTAGQVTKALFEFWHARWGTAYRESYQFAHGRDAGQFKRLLKTLSQEELQKRMARYISDDDPFLSKQRHPLSLFFSQINRWGGTEGEATWLVPVGCKHQPACANDVEHTRRMMAEKRGVRA